MMRNCKIIQHRCDVFISMRQWWQFVSRRVTAVFVTLQSALILFRSVNTVNLFHVRVVGEFS